MTTTEARAEFKRRRDWGLKRRHEERIKRGTWKPYDEWVQQYEDAREAALAYLTLRDEDR
jgi:hypothetical protein